MSARQNTGPDYMGLILPLVMMAVVIYWLVS